MYKPYKKAELTFELGREIGADGKNSRVFIANDQQLNAEIVIKQIEKAKLTSVDEFFSESQSLYASAHSNVVQIHYACFDTENIYIAMPYYSRGSVKPLITGQNLTLRETISSQTLEKSTQLCKREE